jgi:hypothetical protein
MNTSAEINSGDTEPDRPSHIRIIYRSITKSFYDDYEPKHPELESTLCDVLLRNEPIWEELARRGLTEQATKLRQCHATMSTYRMGTRFRNAHYCRMPLLCIHCSKMQAVKRAQEIMAACQLFGNRVKRHKLRMNQYLIVPNMQLSLLSPIDSFRLSFKVVKQFRETLKRSHAEMARQRPRARTSSQRENVLWGPTVNALHVVPRGGGVQYNEDHQLHVHLTVVTPARTSQRSVTNAVTGLWTRALASAGVPRDPERGEIQVRRPYRFQDKKSPSTIALEEQGFRDREFEISDFTDPLETTPKTYSQDHYSLGAPEAFDHMLYVSNFLKPRWEPKTVVDHYRMVTSGMRLQPKQLRQFLGHEGVTARRLPDRFDPMRCGHRYVAKLNDINTRRPWNVYRLYED